MIGITILGIMMAICVRLFMNCICVTFEIVVLLALTVVLLLFGALLVIPAVWGVSYIEENCEYASQGRIDEMD